MGWLKSLILPENRLNKQAFRLPERCQIFCYAQIRFFRQPETNSYDIYSLQR
ncbi:MAG: hypothetical protein IJ881_00500 [Neisseriaceae bacterium]|nr:hypothetical protein [Neisseriaceae bacterium]